ncbi:inner membrane protein [Chlamydia felis Fe/C-56]|uniref:Inner membrane protein n=2 Tax=Chlamydia felis TaxID=83556 RepID=Q253U6_CHLFF|nr:inner membrane protein [Chlamydia felis Fe/C-56]
MEDGRETHHDSSTSEVGRHWLRCFCYLGITVFSGLVLFFFIYLRVLHIPMYKDGDIAQVSINSPIDFSISWNVHAFYSKTAQVPEVFGKVYRICNHTYFEEPEEEETRQWLKKTQDFLKAVGFIDNSTATCLQDLHLRPSALKERDSLLRIHVSADLRDVIHQCLAHVDNFLKSENCPPSCRTYIINNLQEKSLDIAVDKEKSGYIKGDLLGTRRTEYFPKGRPIIKQYQRISERDVKILRCLRHQLASSTTLFSYRGFLGVLLLVAVILIWGYRSLVMFCPELLISPKRFMLYIAIFSLSLIGVKITETLYALGPQSWEAYLVCPLILPFTAILLGHLVGIPLAGVSCTFLGVLYTLESDIWNHNLFIAVNLLSSWRILFTLKRVTHLSSIFWCCMRLWWVSTLILTGLRLFCGVASIKTFRIDCIGSFVYSLITALGVGALIPVFESFFGACTHNHLLAYLDSDYPLLKRLFEEAPGTYQHSVLVGILAESAANAIHADGLFCRVAAQYHDIGKLVNPGFFLENHQMLGTKQNNLSPLESVKMIKQHIPEGVELAKKAGLPDSFIQVIEEHHGTSVILAPYHLHLQNNPTTGALDEKLFRYSGRKPSSKESTIIMIADSFEAAARSLERTSMVDLRELVDKIVAGKMHDGQFAESPVTLDELTTICETMVKTLYSAMHSRAKYPEIALKPCI